MTKTILSMNKDEFKEAIQFMYDIYGQINTEIYNDLDYKYNAKHIAYISYYDRCYNQDLQDILKEEEIIVHNLLEFIDRLNFGKYNYILSIETILNIAYSAIHNKDTFKYFMNEQFPAITVKDKEGIPTLTNEDIIPTIMIIIRP